MTTLLAFLQVLPAILKTSGETFALINRLLDSFERMKTAIGEEQLKKWVNDLEKTTEAAEKATTKEQKQAIARSYVDLIRRL